MQHPYAVLESEYAAYLAHLSVTPSKTGAIDAAAKRILRPENMDVYQAAVEGTQIPAAFIGVLELRESNCDPTRALGRATAGTASPSTCRAAKGRSNPASTR